MECADKREAAEVRGVSARCLEGGGRGGFLHGRVERCGQR